MIKDEVTDEEFLRRCMSKAEDEGFLEDEDYTEEDALSDFSLEVSAEFTNEEVIARYKREDIEAEEEEIIKSLMDE